MARSSKEKAKALKALGVVKYDLRKPLNFGQRMAIEKSYQKYGSYIEKPEKFAAPVVREKTAKALKGSGYLVTPRGRAIIPLTDGAQKARIARIDGDGVIQFEKQGEIRQTLLASRENFLKRLEQLTKKKLGKNQMVTLQIGNHAPFKQKFTSFGQLFYYAEQFTPDDPDEDVENLFPLMSIVTITGPAQTRQAPTKKAGEKGTPTKTRRKK